MSDGDASRYRRTLLEEACEKLAESFGFRDLSGHVVMSHAGHPSHHSSGGHNP